MNELASISQTNVKLTKETASKVEDTIKDGWQNEAKVMETELDKEYTRKTEHQWFKMNLEALELCIKILAEEIRAENEKLNQMPFDQQKASAVNIINLDTKTWRLWRIRAVSAYKKVISSLKKLSYEAK